MAASGERQGAVTLVENVTARLIEQIQSGDRVPGSKLPSIRNAAREYAVSKNTIVEAYERLAAAGYIVSKPRSGFVVAKSAQPTAGRPKHLSEAVDIVSLLNAQLEESFEIRVGDGRPPASWTEESEIRRHLGLVGRGPSSSTDGYGSAWGFPPLRQQIARRLEKQHIQASEKNIILTFGANHALDLVIRAFLTPGDVVLVDEPGYYPLFAKLKLAQVRVVGVRRLPDGPDAEDFAGKAATERPKLFITQSIGHNPTGGSISLSVAHSILTVAARHNVTIVEDDPFADLSPTPPNRLATLDQLNHVISIGTFSKTLSASLRSGHIAGHADKIAALAELKMLTTVNSSGHVERLLHRVASDGHYDRHLKRLGQRIEAAANRVHGALARSGHSIFSGNGGGYYLYLMLPQGINDIELARLGAQKGIFIAPGSVFCLNKQNPMAAGIRINVARADEDRFFDFLLRKLS
ncbi:PLP-dependent aminotransferase family protein [Mesorhizobium sp. M3A.F.Ca.ET.080.04.2.1]|uniref:aminotransferase-like domain-containing protein n=1 Tax=Mesorhizobium sp. M3A.F.Ca.ET.080.04.2.1 TaxID=2493676 RepID=UPI000F759171|nr:PLP-dependent aminotransferase family protein [Mesorhizobium sp. M3A.F.Ca.ET.080.04.2.1]AZO07879.1 PLP-dependent aminotransferase family protein [Mesorhizobium sp. M3A.F.Ca.ET.080.04.2.1]RWF15468.1 MAG: PLP-dependent aminotransferase family protein [Mesorhizobium sp.]